MELIYCEKCRYFDPVESMPSAEKMHKMLHQAFDGVLPVREGKSGVCRKVTFCPKCPVLTKSTGFCHRAKPKEEE